jgi:hypothetical protein
LGGRRGIAAGIGHLVFEPLWWLIDGHFTGRTLCNYFLECPSLRTPLVGLNRIANAVLTFFFEELNWGASLVLVGICFILLGTVLAGVVVEKRSDLFDLFH